jgi:hypothetical protein
MIKHWKSFIKEEKCSIENSIPDNTELAFNKLLKENDSFKTLLNEREKLENDLKNFSRKNTNDSKNDDRYQNEIPNIIRKNKEEFRRQQQKTKSFEKLKKEKLAFKKWIQNRETLNENLKKGKQSLHEYNKKNVDFYSAKERNKKVLKFKDRFSYISKKRDELHNQFKIKEKPKKEITTKIDKDSESLSFLKKWNKKIDNWSDKRKSDEFKEKTESYELKKPIKIIKDDFQRNRKKQKPKFPRDLIGYKIKEPDRSNPKRKNLSNWYREKLKLKGNENFYLKSKLKDNFNEKHEKIRKKQKELEIYEKDQKRIIKNEIKNLESKLHEKNSTPKRKGQKVDFENSKKYKLLEKPEKVKKEYKPESFEVKNQKHYDVRKREQKEEEKQKQREEMRKERLQQERIEQRKAERRSEMKKEQKRYN